MIGNYLLWALGIALVVLAFLNWPEERRERIKTGKLSGAGFVLGAALIMLLLLTGCVTSPPVYGEIPECERLIPASLKADVPGVPIPESEEAEPWMQAFIGQTGQLDKANERPDAIDHIYSNCLKMHRDALRKAKRGFFGRLFG